MAQRENVTNPPKYHRRSIRLEGYDYTQPGAYFVTVCAHERVCLFGSVVDDVMQVNSWGAAVQAAWNQTGVLRQNVVLDAFVVMPNHIHGIIMIVDSETSTPPGRGMMHHALDHPQLHAPSQREFAKPIARSLASIIGAFKADASRRINRMANAPEHPVWQRNYYERIIRSEETLNLIRAYIRYNPELWEKDSLFR